MTIDPVLPGTVPPRADQYRDLARDRVNRYGKAAGDKGTGWLVGGLLVLAVLIGMYFMGAFSSLLHPTGPTKTDQSSSTQPVPSAPTTPQPAAPTTP